LILYVAYFIFDYELTTGTNNIVEYGDSVEISLNVRNISSNPIENMIINASINSSYVTVLTNQVMVGSLMAGESIVLTDAFSFIVHGDIPDKYEFPCELEFNSDSGNWSGAFGMQAFSPVLQMTGPSIIDNDNNRLDPGEMADMFLFINNDGHAKAFDVLGELTVDDQYLTLETSNQLVFGDIETGGSSAQSITISASEDTPAGHSVHFEINYSAWPDIELYYEFDIVIGKLPVFILDLDPDQFSGPIIQSVIDEFDVEHGYDVVFPSDLGQYKNLFVSLGRKWSNHTLTEYEGEKLADFLNDGGNLYMEGGETWSEDPLTMVHPMFNFDVAPTEWHECPSIQGIDGSFTDGMEFNYDSPVLIFNHCFLPFEETVCLLKNSGNQYCYAAAFENDTYKTIGTNFDFGGLIDGSPPSIKYILMGKVLQFFGLDVIISSTDENIAASGITQFNCFPNPAQNNANFSFTLLENQNITLQVFDIHGNMVKTLLARKEYIKGEYQISFNTADLSPGIYLAKLTTDKGTINIKVVVSK